MLPVVGAILVSKLVDAKINYFDIRDQNWNFAKKFDIHPLRMSDKRPTSK